MTKYLVILAVAMAITGAFLHSCEVAAERMAAAQADGYEVTE